MPKTDQNLEITIERRNFTKNNATENYLDALKFLYNGGRIKEPLPQFIKKNKSDFTSRQIKTNEVRSIAENVWVCVRNDSPTKKGYIDKIFKDYNIFGNAKVVGSNSIYSEQQPLLRKLQDTESSLLYSYLLNQETNEPSTICATGHFALSHH